jgi:hypothetical protein
VLFRVAVLWAGLDDDRFDDVDLMMNLWSPVCRLSPVACRHSLVFWVVSCKVGTNLLKASFIISDFCHLY